MQENPNVELTMLVYGKLTSNEYAKLSSIDAEIADILLKAIGPRRAVWIATGDISKRSVQLSRCDDGKILAEFSAEDIVELSASEIAIRVCKSFR